jgi:hypothetical protein
MPAGEKSGSAPDWIRSPDLCLRRARCRICWK